MVTPRRSDASDATSRSPYARTDGNSYRKRVTSVTRRLKRVSDQEFHLWPITGILCSVCQMPIDRVFITTRIHPSCEPIELNTHPTKTTGA